MSAAILQFVPRAKPAPAPAPTHNDITQAECRLLDAVKRTTDHVLDVVNTDCGIIRKFLAGQQLIGATVKHLGREYHIRVSVEEADTGPRTA
jgi:hypothetical protein